MTDAEGKVLVTLTSGTAAGVVSIAGGATAGGISASAVAHRLAIIGAKASGAYVVMDCAEDNVPALLYSDCVASHLVQTVSCKVSLRDRFQNVVGRSTRVQFFAEAGSTGMSAVTPMYPGGVAPGGESDLGIATSAIRTDGKLPIDVPPFGGEFALSYLDACGTYTHNPRDGLVTMIGVVNGEEGFVDWNGNGRHDAGEPYIDLGEPYVDANDNGKYDTGEFFVDVNSNGTYDGPNGQWDANTMLWAETRVLFTGHSFTIADGTTGRLAGSQFYKTGAPPEPVHRAALLGDLGGDRRSRPGHLRLLRRGIRRPELQSARDRDGLLGRDPHHAARPRPTRGPRSLPSVTTSPSPSNTAPCPAGSRSRRAAMCSNVCPSNGDATNSPCYVVTNVGNCTAGTNPRTGCNGFAYATTGTVQITGGATPGSNTVEATATINGVSSSVFVGGTVH